MKKRVVLCFKSFESNRALLVVRLAGFGVEGWDGQFVDAFFGEVERHEDMVGVDGFGDAYHQIVDAATARNERNAIVRADTIVFSRRRIHFHPGFGSQLIQQGDVPGFGSGMPLFNGPSGIEDKPIAAVDILGQFLEDRTELDALAFTAAKDLNLQFNFWCEGQGLSGWTQRTLMKELRQRGFEDSRTSGERGLRGLRLL